MVAQNVCLIAIDEAHLVIDWGVDTFRPQFRALRILKKNKREPFYHVPLLVLPLLSMTLTFCKLTTATVTANAKEQLCNLLNIHKCHTISAPLLRGNLNYYCYPKRDSEAIIVNSFFC